MRTLALTLSYSGGRVSEALELTLEHVDLSAKSLRLCTLKQRNQATYRSVPLPDHNLDALELVHRIRKQQKAKNGGKAKLWSWGRTQATKHIWAIMQAAGIEGDHASPKGLRHGFGVRLAQKTRNPRLVQKLLGHKSLETTAICMDLVGEEKRAEVVGVW